MASMQTTHHLTMRDGEPLFVREIGPADAEPVVILHGFGVDSRMWLPFVISLRRQYRFILPDLRGFGHSHHTNFNRDDALGNHADDLADILDALNIERCKLAGLSMGALSSLIYLSRDGCERVTHYANIDQTPKPINGDGWTWGLFGAGQPEMMRRFENLIAMGDRYPVGTNYQEISRIDKQQMREGFAAFFAYALVRNVQKQAVKAFVHAEPLARQLINTENWRIYLHCMRAYVEQDYDLREALASIHIPVTLMVGMRSEMYPPEGQLQMTSMLPNCRLVTFAGAGHAIPGSEPIKFARELRQFLAQ